MLGASNISIGDAIIALRNIAQAMDSMPRACAWSDIICELMSKDELDPDEISQLTQVGEAICSYARNMSDDMRQMDDMEREAERLEKEERDG